MRQHHNALISCWLVAMQGSVSALLVLEIFCQLRCLLYELCIQRLSKVCTWFFTSYWILYLKVRMFNRRACGQKYTAWHETAMRHSGDIWKLAFLFSFELPQTMSLCERWRKAIQLFIFHVKGSREQEPLPWPNSNKGQRQFWNPLRTTGT